MPTPPIVAVYPQSVPSRFSQQSSWRKAGLTFCCVTPTLELLFIHFEFMVGMLTEISSVINAITLRRRDDEP